MIETVTFLDKNYPAFQTNGNAARFCMPFAVEVCKGFGLDIGCNRAEWSLPGSVLIDPLIDPTHDAMNLPNIAVDYVFSSHCLEHLPNWVDALDHWTDRIRSGGTLFLYLPDESQVYWRPYHNRKHIHQFRPEMLRDYMEGANKYHKVFVSGVDAYNSFTVMAEKI